MKSIEHDYKEPKSVSLTNNIKLAQSGRHQSGSQEVPGSIPTGESFLLNSFCSSLQNPFWQRCQLCIIKGRLVYFSRQIGITPFSPATTQFLAKLTFGGKQKDTMVKVLH